MKIVFAYLTAFNGVGGIERYNRNFCKVLSDKLASNHRICIISLNDQSCDSRYVHYNVKFIPCGGNKWKFIFLLFLQIINSKVIIWGHINLYRIQYLLSIVFSFKKHVLLTHGIEVWRPLNLWARLSVLSMDTILTVSRYTKKIIVSRFHLPEDKVKVIHNTIDPYFILPDISTAIKSSEVFNIVTVCRIKKTEIEKGYDQVLLALSKVNILNFKYQLVGKYDEDEYIRLSTLIKELKLTSKVVLVGYVSDQELQEIYLQSDVFIMPSKKEGFGIVFIEAMLHGLPVIAGNQDGSVDALSNGELGYLIDPSNVNEIVEKLQEVYQLKLKNKLYPSAIQNQVLEKFNYEVFAGRILNEINI